MKEHENDFPLEARDRQTARSSDEHSLEEHQLVQDIYALSQTYARENERSVERIWSRFAQSQLGQQQEPGSKQPVTEGKAMQEKDIYEETGFATLHSQPAHLSRRKSRPPGRLLSISGAVAVVLLMILSWVLLANVLGHGLITTGNQRTQTGSAQ